NHGVDPEHIGQRVNTLLSVVDAQHLLHHHTQTLSGGWVQRIATVAALAAKPQIVLADEPTSMLDGAGVAKVMHKLSQQNGSRSALVLVEHRLDKRQDGPGLPQRTVVINDGRSQADGTTHQVHAEHDKHLEANGVWNPGGQL